MAFEHLDFEDRIVIALPEGIEQELILAGLGSRTMAAAIDMAIRFAAIFAYALVAGAIAAWIPAAEGYAVAGWVATTFLFTFGYDVAFETWGGGRTPGKRWTGIQVVREGGLPVAFKASAIRNLLRLVDALPTGFLVGILSILVSKHNQRIGDRVANTLVVRYQGVATAKRRSKAAVAPSPPPTSGPAVTWPEGSESSATPAGPRPVPRWDVSTISAEELVLVRQFLARRQALAPEARQRLAWQLAEALRSKVGGAPDGLPPEDLLEGLAAAKVARL